MPLGARSPAHRHHRCPGEASREGGEAKAPTGQAVVPPAPDGIRAPAEGCVLPWSVHLRNLRSEASGVQGKGPIGSLAGLRARRSCQTAESGCTRDSLGFRGVCVGGGPSPEGLPGWLPGQFGVAFS